MSRFKQVIGVSGACILVLPQTWCWLGLVRCWQCAHDSGFEADWCAHVSSSHLCLVPAPSQSSKFCRHRIA